MKNLLYLLSALVILSACSKDSGETKSKWSSYNHLAQIWLSYEGDGLKGPEGEVFFFKLDGRNVGNYTPNIGELGYKNLVCWILDVNGERIYNTHKDELYVTKDKDTGLYLNSSVGQVFWRDLGYHSQTTAHVYMVVRIPGGAYDEVYGSTAVYYTMTIEVTDFKKVEKTIPKLSEWKYVSWD